MRLLGLKKTWCVVSEPFPGNAFFPDVTANPMPRACVSVSKNQQDFTSAYRNTALTTH